MSDGAPAPLPAPSVPPMGSNASRPADRPVPAPAAPPPAPSLKRRASSPLGEPRDGGARKRLKEAADPVAPDADATPAAALDGQALADDLAQELQCGCCAGLLHRPVVVNPCQHWFCGSCCALWIRNGGTNCPACRGISIAVAPSRALESMVAVLLRAAPAHARPERERLQADEVYSGGNLRIPLPREASPLPSIPQTNPDYARPCPHCAPGNAYSWRCPQPIRDPDVDPDGAWHLDDGTPPGHAYCGNCEDMLALGAPSTTKCDLCQVSFCGIGVQGRCAAAPLLAQQPHQYGDTWDLIQAAEVYDCFDGNAVEVDILIDYLNAQRYSPRHIYREIVQHIQSQPRGFAPLLELDMFADLHSVAGGADPDAGAPRARACRMCAAEVFVWGLRAWWLRERARGLLGAGVAARADCADGRLCTRQKDMAHAKEFNHVVADAPLAGAAGEASAPASVSVSASAQDTGGAESASAPSSSAAGDLAPIATVPSSAVPEGGVQVSA